MPTPPRRPKTAATTSGTTRPRKPRPATPPKTAPGASVPPARKDEIIAVTQRLFRELGFQATSMRDIARALKLRPGSLYSHIAGKDDLLWEMAAAAGDRFFAMLEPIAAADRIVVSKLRDAIRGHVRVITDDLDAAAIFSSEWRHLSPPRRAEFVARRDRYESIFAGLVRQGVEEGQFGVADPRYATLMLLSTLNSIHHWYRPDGRLTPGEIADLVAEFVFDGLKRAQ